MDQGSLFWGLGQEMALARVLYLFFWICEVSGSRKGSGVSSQPPENVFFSEKRKDKISLGFP